MEDKRQSEKHLKKLNFCRNFSFIGEIHILLIRQNKFDYI